MKRKSMSASVIKIKKKHVVPHLLPLQEIKYGLPLCSVVSK